MSKKIIILAVVVGVIAAAIVIGLNKTGQVSEIGNTENEERAVKEFAMESFVEFADGKPKPQFSVKEITVNKGDLVKLKITVTSGMHDFKIDEFDVYADTKELNKEYLVEFTADKVGEFVYYCNQPGHRTNGHWGTLKVLE